MQLCRLREVVVKQMSIVFSSANQLEFYNRIQIRILAHKMHLDYLSGDSAV